MSVESRRVVGVDVGGTFTDVFVLDELTGQCRVAKVPTETADQSVGVEAGVAAAVGDLADLTALVHGTTVGTNALLQRTAARTGIITTRGFGDVLEMRRRDRPTTWGLWGTYRPVVPRDLRMEVEERVLADGTVHTEVDPDEVRDAARALLAAGVEAICLFFVNAYANPRNERAALAAVREVWPNPHVTAASEILPEIREFERLSTAALNACLQPTVGEYLGRLERRLVDRGLAGEVLIVQSNGGVMAVDTARARPIHTALSGPAAGVIAGARIARAAGYPDVITCDMGGTSFDVALVSGAEPAITAQSEVEFGLVVRTPMIDIHTIGAGGGSIAGVDRGGLLTVGPESAGASPGPACYRRGNERPTVTDANLVLGRINPDAPLGEGLRRLDVEAARGAIETHVGGPLGLDPDRAAEAIVRVANARMADAIRLVSIERGHDPKRFAAMPFGGGGALHVSALIEEVGLARALVPRHPGVTSAIGCVVADVRHDGVRTVNVALDALDGESLARAIEAIAEESEALVKRARVPVDRIERRVELDMLYQGQTHTVVAVLEDGAPPTKAAVAAAFESAYRAAFGRVLEDVPVRVVNVRVSTLGRRPPLDLRLLAPRDGGPPERCRIGERLAWADGRKVAVPIYERLRLAVGSTVRGPAVLEQPDATTWLDPGHRARVDSLGNLVVEREDG